MDGGREFDVEVRREGARTIVAPSGELDLGTAEQLRSALQRSREERPLVLDLRDERSGRRYVPEDLRFVEVLAGRVALALDNAGLFIELQTMEARLTAVLGSLTEAVTVRGARGGLIYADQAAAELLGFDSPQALLTTPARQIAARYDSLREPGGSARVFREGTPQLVNDVSDSMIAAAARDEEQLEAVRGIGMRAALIVPISLCTAVCLVLRELEDGAEADVICAGHPLPVLVLDGVAQPVGRFRPMLGAFEDEGWEPHTLAVRPRDVLVLYSDAVLDAVGAEDRFGPERLLETLNGATGAADAVARIERALSGFEVGAQADDTAILAVERIGARAPLSAEPDRPGEPAGR